MNQLVIVGAGGHGKVVADIALRNGYKDIIFLDDNYNAGSYFGFKLAGKTDLLTKYKNSDVFIAIGDAGVRERFMEEYSYCNFVTLIHPSAVIGENVRFDKGTVVMAGSVINADTSIGKGCIINTCASVDHDNYIEDFVHIAVGAHLCGTVVVRKRTFIGVGASVINNIEVCSDCVVGAGAVVIDDIDEVGKYIGIPAKRYM